MYDDAYNEIGNYQNIEHLQILKRSLDQIEWRLQQKLQMLNREYRCSSLAVKLFQVIWL